jgi:hypothetical protein
MIGRGNQSTRRKPAPVPLCPPQTPHAVRTRTRAAAVGSQRLTAELRHGGFQPNLRMEHTAKGRKIRNWSAAVCEHRWGKDLNITNSFHNILNFKRTCIMTVKSRKNVTLPSPNQPNILTRSQKQHMNESQISENSENSNKLLKYAILVGCNLEQDFP